MFEEFVEPWLRLRKKQKNLILARGETHYFFIEVNRNLDHEAEQALQEQGVSDALLKELQLSFLAVPINQIRGIAVETTYRGGELYLYMTSGKRELYNFFETCEESQLEMVFPGVARFNPPKPEGKHMPKEERWRVARQDKRTYTYLAYVNGFLCIAGAACSFLYAMTVYWAFLLGCIGIFAAFAALEILLPAYVTLIPREKGYKKKKESAIDLTVGITLVTVFLALAGDFEYLSQGKTYLYALGFAFVISILLRYLAEEFRRDKDAIAIVFAFSILLGTVLAGNINIALDFSEPEESYILPAQDLYKSSSSKGGNRYYCVVTLPDGNKMKIQIGRKLYDDLAEGDLVQVEINKGLLGIEYTEVFDAE